MLICITVFLFVHADADIGYINRVFYGFVLIFMFLDVPYVFLFCNLKRTQQNRIEKEGFQYPCTSF